MQTVIASELGKEAMSKILASRGRIIHSTLDRFSDKGGRSTGFTAKYKIIKDLYNITFSTMSGIIIAGRM